MCLSYIPANPASSLSTHNPPWVYIRLIKLNIRIISQFRLPNTKA